MDNRVRFQVLRSLALCGCTALGGYGEQMRFDTASEWRRWELPLGAVELTQNGTIRPVRIRKEINAALNAADFGGGIRSVGSNSGQAAFVMDGDPATGWSLDPNDSPEDWFIEIDLGRAVAARGVTLVFDEEAPPFELFRLFLSTGESAIDAVGNIVESSLIYRFRERFKENKRHRVTLDLDLAKQPPVQFLRVESLLHVAGARLVEVEVEAIGDNITLGLLERGGGLEIVLDVEGASDAVTLGNAMSIADGNFSVWLQPRRINSQVNVISHMTLDLGAVYWVDLVRIVGHFLLGPRSRSYFDFDTYEVLSSAGSLAPDGTRIWHRHFVGKSTAQHQLWPFAEHHFELIQTRYVRIAWVYFDAACAALWASSIANPCNFYGSTRELQVFGEGHPARVTFRSPLIDLKGNKQVSAIRWRADTSPDARIEVRSRTSNEVRYDITYYDKNGKQVTKRKWDKLIPSFRGSVDTTSVPGDDQSPWSNVYLAPDQRFQSPSPRRYMELEVSLVSENPDRAASLDYLEVEFYEPLADEVVGEIFPTEVLPGEATEFSYFVRPGRTSGFDRLMVVASAPMQFREVLVGEKPAEAEVEETGEGFQVEFPRPIRQRELVELRFTSSVFLQSTRFDVFLVDSGQEELGRQAVEPGDAAPAVESSTNVVSLPVSARLFANAELDTRVLTPNGDRRNDVLVVSVDLVNVLEQRPLRMRVFDLSGRLLGEVEGKGLAGHRELIWDGRDSSGRLVVPGLYLLELHMEGDARVEKVRWGVSVVY